MGIILAWLDDVLPGKRDKHPASGDEASQAALASPDGRALLLWLALRDQGVSYSQAWRMEPSEIEFFRVSMVLFGHRKSWKPREEKDNGDVADTWCGKGLASLCSQIGIAQVGAMTFDQVEWLITGGNVDEHANPVMSDGEGFERAVAMYKAAVGDQPQEDETKAEEEISFELPPGWRVKEDGNA